MKQLQNVQVSEQSKDSLYLAIIFNIKNQKNQLIQLYGDHLKYYIS
jgi:hypothetical protein